MVSFQAFGVHMWVATNRREALERIHEILPPGWSPCDEATVEHRLGIIGDDRGTYAVDLGGVLLVEGVTLDLALETLNSVVQSRLAFSSPDRIFVHAGVVAYEGT